MQIRFPDYNNATNNKWHVLEWRVPECMKFLKDSDGKVKATSMFGHTPGVYTGLVGDLQKAFPEWYSNVYSGGNPPVPPTPTCCSQ